MILKHKGRRSRRRQRAKTVKRKGYRITRRKARRGQQQQRGGAGEQGAPPASMSDHIHHVFYINLDKRPDRKEQIEKELNGVFPPEKITRIAGIYDEQHPALGCTKSHMKAVQAAKDGGYPNALILEDDFMWTNVKEAYPVFEKLIKEDFDVLMLGGTSAVIDPATYRVKRSQSTHGYIVKQPYYQKIIDKHQASINDFGAGILEKAPFPDLNYLDLQKTDKWFVVEPPLSIQRPSYSDIEKKDVNYKDLFMVKKEGEIVN
jgi:hypothetical protein